MPEVWWQEYHRAYAVWRELTNHALNKNSEGMFDYFLVGEVIRGSRAQRSMLSLTDEQLNRLRWLTGPNAKALYKAWKAQNEKPNIGRTFP